MYFGSERHGQGEVEGTSWRHWLNHVRYLSNVINMESDTSYRTLYESKGLEFNDVGYLSSTLLCPRVNTFIQVLLYDFFEDSSVDVAQWRVVLNAISRAQRERIPAPNFDENRHAGVCAEVRQNTSLRPVLYLMSFVDVIPPGG